MLNPCVLPTVREWHEIYHKESQCRAMLLIANGFQHTSLWSNPTQNPFYMRILLTSGFDMLILRTFRGKGDKIVSAFK